MNKKMRIIIRAEADYDGKGFHYVAIFPDDPANPGRVGYIPFDASGGYAETIGVYDEMTLSWYYVGTRHMKPHILEYYGIYDAVRKWYAEDGVEVEFRSKLPDLSKTAWAWALKKGE